LRGGSILIAPNPYDGRDATVPSHRGVGAERPERGTRSRLWVVHGKSEDMFDHHHLFRRRFDTSVEVARFEMDVAIEKWNSVVYSRVGRRDDSSNRVSTE